MKNEHGIDPAYEAALGDHQIDFSKADKYVWFVGLESRYLHKDELAMISYHYVIGPEDGYTVATKVAVKFGETYRLIQLNRQGKIEEL